MAHSRHGRNEANVRYGRTSRQVVLHVLIAVFWFAAWMGVYLAQSGDERNVALAASVGTATLLVMVILDLRAGIELTPTHVIVRGAGHRRIPWISVIDISVKRVALSSTLVIATPAGNVRVTGLATGPLDRDPDFDDKVEAVRSWWVDARRATVEARGHVHLLEGNETGWGIPIVPHLDAPAPSGAE